MASRIDGPRVAAKSRQPRQLVVFLHGYGADGHDLIEVARQWQPWLPDAEFIAPHGSGSLYAIAGRPPVVSADLSRSGRAMARRRCSASGLDAFLDSELDRMAIDDSKLALVGFSQGTMMALHVGLRRRRVLAAISWLFGTARRTRTPGRVDSKVIEHKAPADPVGSRGCGPGDSPRCAVPVVK